VREAAAHADLKNAPAAPILRGAVDADVRIMVRIARPSNFRGASVAVEGFAMLAYLAIVGASLAGYAGLPPWTMAATVIVLSSISYTEHGRSYERARNMRLFEIVDAVMLRSVFNAVLASLAAYGFGYFLRLI
jgi:hypothetical protein